jgi:hypothetical protein
VPRQVHIRDRKTHVLIKTADGLRPIGMSSLQLCYPAADGSLVVLGGAECFPSGVERLRALVLEPEDVRIEHTL